jgi:hydroxymethylpyrimidine/phosphomethylpyrimidine kinase
VLAIGGLDPGGGAGVLADARAIARAGAFACAAVAVLTVQSTSGLRSATPVPSAEVIAECTEVTRHQSVRALKLGALGSADNTRAIARFLGRFADLPAVVDTVMVPTRGRARLLDERAVAILRAQVLPRSALATVNAPEAAILTGQPVTDLAEAHAAARALLRLGGRGVLVKGGHLGGPRATDVLALAGPKGAVRVVELTAPRLPLPPFHGGGCILASLIAGRLATTAEAYREDPARARGRARRGGARPPHPARRAARDAGGELLVLLA